MPPLNRQLQFNKSDDIDRFVTKTSTPPIARGLFTPIADLFGKGKEQTAIIKPPEKKQSLLSKIFKGNVVRYERQPKETAPIKQPIRETKTIEVPRIKPEPLEGSFKGTNYDPMELSQNRPDATPENIGEGAVAGLKVDDTMVAVPRKNDNLNAMIKLGSVIYIPELDQKFLVADLMNKRFNGIKKIDFATIGSGSQASSTHNRDFSNIIILRKGKGRADAREYVNSGKWKEELSKPFERLFTPNEQ